MKKLFKSILNIGGWQIEGQVDNLPYKCVLCVAPHTSNWDLILGKVVYLSLGRKSYFLIKKSWFFFPMNLVFRWLGGIPVDRSKKTSLTTQMAVEFNKRKDFQLAITPEGTRKKTEDWKRGFYYIALEAKVPIVIAAFDYSKKIVAVKDVFVPTGDADADIEQIKNYYVGVEGRHKHLF